MYDLQYTLCEFRAKLARAVQTRISFPPCFLINSWSSLLLRDDGEEFEGFGLGGVHQAVAVAFGAVEAIVGRNLSADALLAGSLFDGGSVTFGDEDHLAAVFMGVEADGCAGNKAASEYAVGAVEEHVGMEFLFSSLEAGEYAEIYLVESDFHDSRLFGLLS